MNYLQRKVMYEGDFNVKCLPYIPAQDIHKAFHPAHPRNAAPSSSIPVKKSGIKQYFNLKRTIKEKHVKPKWTRFAVMLDSDAVIHLGTWMHIHLAEKEMENDQHIPGSNDVAVKMDARDRESTLLLDRKEQAPKKSISNDALEWSKYRVVHTVLPVVEEKGLKTIKVICDLNAASAPSFYFPIEPDDDVNEAISECNDINNIDIPGHLDHQTQTYDRISIEFPFLIGKFKEMLVIHETPSRFSTSSHVKSVYAMPRFRTLTIAHKSAQELMNLSYAIQNAMAIRKTRHLVLGMQPALVPDIGYAVGHMSLENVRRSVEIMNRNDIKHLSVSPDPKHSFISISGSNTKQTSLQNEMKLDYEAIIKTLESKVKGMYSAEEVHDLVEEYERRLKEEEEKNRLLEQQYDSHFRLESLENADINQNSLD